MKLFCSLVKGYYYPTRRNGHGRIFSLFNGIFLALWALKDTYEKSQR
jgi:hypothetical protein